MNKVDLETMIINLSKITLDNQKRIEALEKQVSGIIALINANVQGKVKN